VALQTLEVECWFLIPVVRDSDRGVHQPVSWRLLEEALSDAWGGWTGPETMRWGRKPPSKLDDLRALLKRPRIRSINRRFS